MNDLVFSGSSDQSVHAHNIHVSLIYEVEMISAVKTVKTIYNVYWLCYKVGIFKNSEC